MAFLRFSRDKRGYENIYLVQPTGRRGKSSHRVLYWFRTPPNLKVGREPFDANVRRALETQYREITFDWPRLMATPIPPPDKERWRERRRVDRAARRPPEIEDREAPEISVEGSVETVPEGEAPGQDQTGNGEGQAAAPGQTSEGGAVGGPRRRRRRRRRGRRGRGGRNASVALGGPETNTPDPGRTAVPEEPFATEPDSDGDV